MSDWATEEATDILIRAWSDTPHAELRAWLAAKLRVIHNRGVGEGIERLGKALNGSAEPPAAEPDVEWLRPSDSEAPAEVA